jgi:hypothetical protein
VIVAWGHNREIHGNLNGYLLEWDWQATVRGAVYGRAEVVDKDILTLGSLHPRGFIHFHQISRVAALTVGRSICSCAGDRAKARQPRMSIRPVRFGSQRVNS